MATLLVLSRRKRNIRSERVFRDRTQPLDTFNDDKLIARYRFPRHVTLNLVDRASAYFGTETRRSYAIPEQLQILVTLRYLAKGDLYSEVGDLHGISRSYLDANKKHGFDFNTLFHTLKKCEIFKILVTLRYLAKGDLFSEVGDLHGISRSSVSRIVHRVCEALCKTLNNINFPSTVRELRTVKQQFYRIASFPNVVGAVDGTLIPIMGMSTQDEAVYVCRKNFHALNIQAIVDADLRFININCQFPGATHDAFILQASGIPDIMSRLPEKGHLLGDSGYPLRDWLLTPFLRPQTALEEKYNKAHCSTRNTVERAFGVLKSRFRCLHKCGGYLPFQPAKCAKVMETCCRLHNMALNEKVPLRGAGVVCNIYQNHIVHDLGVRTAQQKRLAIAAQFS